MIMAGRGKRLGDLANQTKKVGSGDPPTSTTETYDLPTLIKKISELDLINLQTSDLNEIQNSFKQLCTTKEVLKDIFSDFHEKALADSKFGEKFLTALAPVFALEINDIKVRFEFLPFLQNDFQAKDSVAQSDHKKFLNGVQLLGNFYNKVKVFNAPITVLSKAICEYLEMLLKGEEEDMKVLTSQILLNGQLLSLENQQKEEFNLLQHKLRDTLISKSISDKCKQWILLAIDYITNNYKPLTGAAHEYYMKNLEDDYKDLQATIKVEEPLSPVNNSFSSPESAKSQENTSPKQKNFKPKDLSEKFNNMGLSKSDENKEKFKGPRKDNQKWSSKDKPKSSKGYSSSGHDDRFEKDEDFYGKQMPRRPKPENPNRSFK